MFWRRAFARGYNGLTLGGQDTVVGIDLGTTNSVVAGIVDGRVEVIRDGKGKALVPSVVAFLPNGQTLVGRRARARMLIDAPNTVFSAKRIIGRPCSAPDTQRIIGTLPYVVLPGENDEALVQTRAGAMPVVDIASKVLSHLRGGAESRLGRTVKACVVTVPANFTDSQREATRRAAANAGMQVLRILNEPTAAAVALGLGATEDKRIAVFDLGGGTFDLTVLSVHDNLYEVLATGGEPYLGGDDFDQALADRLAMDFLQKHRVDLNADPGSRAQLLQAAEDIKVTLTEDGKANGVVPGIAFGDGGTELDLEYSMSRAEFETLIAPQIDRTIELTARVLKEADVSASTIDEVALVGGSTFIPLVRRRVARFFGREPRTNVNPLEVVATGAAMQAKALWSVMKPPEPRPRATAAAPEPEPELPPALLMDVTSRSLGIATVGDNVQTLIEKNTTIPCESVSSFATSKDNQTEVSIRICQGESKRFSETELLGELKLSGLQPAPRGQTRVDVEFIVDANGILQVSARDEVTGRQEQAVLSVLGVGASR